MKKVIPLLLLFVFIVSCDKDNDDILLSKAESNALNEMVKQGEWKVSSFVINGEDKTAYYSDYFFKFKENNNISAENNSEEMIGTWRINNDMGGEFDSYYDVDFALYFNSQGKFGELTSEYDVKKATNSKIELNKMTVDGELASSLTFSKN
ncbi:hypothetical protein [Gramella sp. AN32]|uniref:Lipocalin-like domain-containing protein n=1 Tax=Christiangramia antarctica TaxID=2058158 RepID=A0ABW5X7A0_9FLAO|nr:hypothetical protein [Gramella sp. AN32]MCM4156205.1 hypothetical protein [Gramella sp. AN32]